MRVLNLTLCVLMAFFAALQYNDPDGPIWMALYGIPAIWAGLAGIRPELLGRPAVKAGLAACLAVYVAATVYFWPPEGGWWRIDVWWDSEESREGMGLMICTAVLALAGLPMLLGGRRQAASSRRA